MRAKYWTISTFLIASLFLVWASSQAQNLNANVGGTVTDSTGAVVPKAELSLTGVATGVVTKVTSGPDGLFSFPNLQPGAYSLKASAHGFRDFLQNGITLNVNEKVRVDVKLEVGSALQRIEVTANVSPLNHENAEHRETITPDVLRALPLEVAGGSRSAACSLPITSRSTAPRPPGKSFSRPSLAPARVESINRILAALFYGRRETR